MGDRKYARLRRPSGWGELLAPVAGLRPKNSLVAANVSEAIG